MRFFKTLVFQENLWLPLLAMEASRQSFFCELCEMDFDKEKELKDHEGEHVICGLEGCKYTACPDVRNHSLVLVLMVA